MFLQQILRKDEKKSKDLPFFLGFSPSGVVEGDVVYANFGTLEDFKKLKAMGVSVKKKIVLVRQGRVFRGNKVCTMPSIYRKLPLISPGLYDFVRALDELINGGAYIRGGGKSYKWNKKKGSK